MKSKWKNLYPTEVNSKGERVRICLKIPSKNLEIPKTLKSIWIGVWNQFLTPRQLLAWSLHLTGITISKKYLRPKDIERKAKWLTCSNTMLISYPTRMSLRIVLIDAMLKHVESIEVKTRIFHRGQFPHLSMVLMGFDGCDSFRCKGLSYDSFD